MVMDNTKQVRSEPPKSAPRPPKHDARPLAEEIEDEMRDRDIPVETGVRPGSNNPG